MFKIAQAPPIYQARICRWQPLRRAAPELTEAAAEPGTSIRWSRGPALAMTVHPFPRRAQAYPELLRLSVARPLICGSHFLGGTGETAPLWAYKGDIRNIQGEIIGLQAGGAGGAFYISRSFNPKFAHYSGGWTNIGQSTFGASRVVPKAEEHRPANQAVRFHIRTRP